MGRKTAALGGHAVQLVRASRNYIDVVGNCQTGIPSMRTRLEADGGVAKCDRLVVAGDAVSQLGDGGQLDGC